MITVGCRMYTTLVSRAALEGGLVRLIWVLPVLLGPQLRLQRWFGLWDLNGIPTTLQFAHYRALRDPGEIPVVELHYDSLHSIVFGKEFP